MNEQRFLDTLVNFNITCCELECVCFKISKEISTLVMRAGCHWRLNNYKTFQHIFFRCVHVSVHGRLRDNHHFIVFSLGN